jgi:AAA15 family ATPase/GTPase
MISKIEIDSFRSIWKEILEVDSINVFSGLNDVGKSNVLKAINLFFNGQTDFGVLYNFDIDYSKVSLAAAQRSNKKKQQIKVKIYFKIPPSFKSLQGEDVWVERIFDRYGRMTENTSIDDAKKRSLITRFVNSIQYFYIPALKGPDVLRYILGEVGKRQLVSDKDIQQLNDKVNDSIEDLTKILTDSAIKNETRFELPVLVEDFWQKLNINTRYDEFSELDEKINPSRKGRRDSLKKESFQVPLQLRGDGVKSKFIPPLLQWIQRHEANKFYVWGIDEPENSLEFKKAQEVADLYYTEYTKNTQLFLTSHSLAFIFTDNQNVSVIRCYKGDYGETKFESFNNLFKISNKLDLADEIGALEIQKEAYSEWKMKDKQVENLKNEIQKHVKPLIITEGNNIEHIRQAINILDKNILDSIDILTGAESKTGRDQIKTVFEIMSQRKNGHKIIFVWDCDAKDKIEPLIESSTVFKFCFKKNSSNNKVKKGIENLYSENIFTDDCYNNREEIDDYGARKINQEFDKNKFLRKIKDKTDKDTFRNFKPFISKLKTIIKK